MKRLLAIFTALLLATASWAGVISVSVVHDAGPDIEDNEIFTMVWYAEDTDAVGGIVGADLRVQYKSLELDVVSMTDNFNFVQAASAYPPGFQSAVLGSIGMVDDGAGMISSMGGVIYPYPPFMGVPIGTNGSPAVIGAVEFQVLPGVLSPGQHTHVSLLHNALSTTDSFGRGDLAGGDDGQNLPLDTQLPYGPEPATLLVLGSGLVALLGVRNRRRLV